MSKKNPALSKFLMTLAATTVSIVLTFGTTAIIDRKKKNDAKREMVLMIMYDMRESLKEIEQCGKSIETFVDTQVEAVAHPREFNDYYATLVLNIPILSYATTTETIFRSNVETIQTIGNILFVESVSSFYDMRERYKRDVADAFSEAASKAVAGYERLRDFESDFYPFSSKAYLRSLKESFEQCKLMMKVKDKELEVFSMQKQKILDATGEDNSYDSAEALRERQQRKNRLQQAREAGERELQ